MLKIWELSTIWNRPIKTKAPHSNKRGTREEGKARSLSVVKRDKLPNQSN